MASSQIKTKYIFYSSWQPMAAYLRKYANMAICKKTWPHSTSDKLLQEYATCIATVSFTETSNHKIF